MQNQRDVQCVSVSCTMSVLCPLPQFVVLLLVMLLSSCSITRRAHI